MDRRAFLLGVAAGATQGLLGTQVGAPVVVSVPLARHVCIFRGVMVVWELGTHGWERSWEGPIGSFHLNRISRDAP
jgi:hypothetical protein